MKLKQGHKRNLSILARNTSPLVSFYWLSSISFIFRRINPNVATHVRNCLHFKCPSHTSVGQLFPFVYKAFHLTVQEPPVWPIQGHSCGSYINVHNLWNKLTWRSLESHSRKVYRCFLDVRHFTRCMKCIAASLTCTRLLTSLETCIKIYWRILTKSVDVF